MPDRNSHSSSDTRALAYWRETLSQDSRQDRLNFPLDHDRAPSTLGSRPHAYEVLDIPAELRSALEAGARTSNVSPDHVLLTAWILFLARHVHQEYIRIGCVLPATHGVVPLTMKVTLEDSFASLLARTSAAAAGGARHAIPFPTLCSALGSEFPQLVVDEPPYFQSVFASGPWEVSITPGPDDVDLGWVIPEIGSSTSVSTRLVYNPDLFERHTVERLAERLLTLLGGIVDNIEEAVGNLPVMPAAERQQTLTWGQGPKTPFADRSTIHSLFEEQVARRPDATALVFRSEAITYGDLNRRADAVADDLRKAGVTTGDRVALLVERGVHTVVAVYGVLKAGGAYIPIDPESPSIRMAQMLADCNPSAVVTEGDFEDRLPSPAKWAILEISPDGHTQIQKTLGLPASDVIGAEPPRPSDPVYCCYTSGTSGQPKAVVIEHRALVQRMSWTHRAFGITEASVIPLKTNYIWGTVEWELFAPLTAGGTLAICEPGRHRDPDYLWRFFQDHRVDVVFILPSMLRAILGMLESGALPTTHRKALRHAVCVGESLSSDLCTSFCNTFGESARIHNCYGLTETSLTLWSCPPSGPTDKTGSGVPIGRPIENTCVRLLDRKHRLVPIGVQGELCFGGYLARGYLGAGDLDRFIDSPTEEDGRLFRTGDLAQWNDEGQLLYDGRMDRQVKVRGQRVELQEIEAVVRRDQTSSGEIRDVAAIATREEPTRLVVYVTPGGIDTAAVAEHCRQVLPRDIVPSAFIELETLPSLPNGKPDHKALMDRAEEDLASTQNHTELASSASSGFGNISEFLASDSAEGARRMGVDSLGLLRMFNTSYLHEAKVLDNVRAYFMIGIILTHWLGCTVAKCDALEGIVPLWVETVVRAFAGIACLTGFAMVGAYGDAQNEDRYRWTRREAVLLVTYLLMRWGIPHGIDGVTPWQQVDPVMMSQHQWWLLMLLYCKVFLVVCHSTRIPASLQVAGLFVLALVAPHNVGDLAQYEGTWLEGAGRIFFVEFYEGGFYWEDDWYWISSTAIVKRIYVIYGALYVASFHYLPGIVRYATARVPSRPVLRRGIPILCAGLFITGSLATAVWHPTETALTYGDVDGTWFLPDAGSHVDWLLELIISIALSVCLVVAMAGSPLRLKWLGASTLGSYVFHTYFDLYGYIQTAVIYVSPAGGVVQLLLILAFPLVFMATLGPALQWFLLIPFQGVLWLRQALAKERQRRISGGEGS